MTALHSELRQEVTKGVTRHRRSAVLVHRQLAGSNLGAGNGFGENLFGKSAVLALKSMRQEVRRWHLQLKCEKSLLDISRMFNPMSGRLR